MNQIIAGPDGVESYQYDIVVHVESIKLHNECFLNLFECFCNTNVAVYPTKWQVQPKFINYLGCTVDGKRFTPDMIRLAPLILALSPTNISPFRSQISALQYNSRLIPNFTQI